MVKQKIDDWEHEHAKYEKYQKQNAKKLQNERDFKAGKYMTKQQYMIAVKAFLDAFFKLTENMQREPDDFQYYSIPIAGSAVWIVSHNYPNKWYELSSLSDDGSSWKPIRRAYISTKGFIQVLLKAYLDYIDDKIEY